MSVDLEEALSGADDAVRPLLKSIKIEDLARHNAGYARYDAARFDRFVSDERGRFERAARLVLSAKPDGSTIADLGCFVPYLPVTLARLGYRVRIVERFELYGPSFHRGITTLAEHEGIEIVELDLSQDELQELGENDVVLLMAVLEHLLGSPAPLMRRIRTALKPDGMLLVDVPNLAELGKRIALARGRSPLAPYGDYLASAYPFSGHHREMTLGEVRQLLETTGYTVDHLEAYDYSPVDELGTRARILRRIKPVLPQSVREEILAVARPQFQAEPAR